MAQEIDEFDGLDENQEPEKSKKKKGGMSLPVMIGIGFGAIVVQVVLIIVVVNFVLPKSGADEANHKSEKMTEKQKQKSEDEKFFEGDTDEEDFFAEEKERKYLETDKIITNPKGSTKFVVLNLGLEYKFKPEVPEPERAADSDLMKKLMARLKTTVIQDIGSKSVDEIHNSRSTYDVMIKEKLKPVFKESKIFLRNVFIVEFIIQ